MRMDLRVDDSGDPVAQLRMLRNLQRAYDERDYETLAVFAPEGARDLYAALAASRRGDRQAARERAGGDAGPAGLVGLAGRDGRRRPARGGLPAAGAEGRGPLLQQAPRDHHALHLVGALVDLGDLGVAHHPLDREVLGVAGAAEQLDGVGGHLHGDVGGERLGRRARPG